MCLIISTTTGKKPRLRVVRRDMTVYKIIYLNNISYHTRFAYEVNTEYQQASPLKIVQEPCTIFGYSVNEGYHSFSTFKSALISFDMLTVSGEKMIKLVAFTIPRGAKYIHGLCGEVVSNRIRSGNLEHLTKEI